jgi:hypothetical protein
MKFARALGEINYKIIFSIFFFVLVGSYSIITKIGRIFKRETVEMKTGWLNKKYTCPDLDNIKRPF